MAAALDRLAHGVKTRRKNPLLLAAGATAVFGILAASTFFVLHGQKAATTQTPSAHSINSTFTAPATALRIPTVTASPTLVPTAIGGGGSIVISYGNTIYRVDPSGQTPPQSIVIVDNLTAGSFIFVSPDGTKAAYNGATDVVGVEHIFVLDLLTRTHTDVSPNISGYFPVIRWSGDSQRVFFLATDLSSVSAYIVKADGSQETFIRKWDSPYWETFFTMSPTGDYVAFNQANDIWTILTDLTQYNSRFANNISRTGGVLWGNVWSPDGRQVAFIMYTTPGGPLGLYAASATGSSLAQKIADLPATAADRPSVMSWSPNGKYIAINGGTANNTLVVDMASGKVTTIGLGHYSAWNYWSPDSSVMLLLSKGGLYSVRRDGTDQRQITDFYPIDDVYGWFLP
jgi:hypothetical protein